MLWLKPLADENASLSFMRRTLDLTGDKASTLKGITRDEVTLRKGLAGYWFSTKFSDSEKVIMYLHGGGYVMGSTRSHRSLLERLASCFAGKVLSIDYSLAPENPFPVAINEAFYSYKWLLDNGYSERNIVIAGDSAGGGLALSTLINLREEGLPLPAGGILISPWTDLALSGGSLKTNKNSDPIIRRDLLEKFANLYLNGALPTTPLASPLYARLSDLPPVLIQVGDREMLLDDSKRLSEKLTIASNNHEFQLWEKMFHVWHLFAPILDEGYSAIKMIAKFADEKISACRKVV